MYTSYIRGAREEPNSLRVLSTIVALSISVDFCLSIAVCHLFFFFSSQIVRSDAFVFSDHAKLQSKLFEGFNACAGTV